MSLQKKIEKVMCSSFPGFWLQAFKELFILYLFPLSSRCFPSKRECKITAFFIPYKLLIKKMFKNVFYFLNRL